MAWALLVKLTLLLRVSAPNATAGFSQQPRQSSISSRGNFSVQKHHEGDLVPLSPTSACSSVLSPRLLWPRRRSISGRSTRRAKAWEGNVVSCKQELWLAMALWWPSEQRAAEWLCSPPHLQPLAGICPPAMQDGSRQALAVLSPSAFRSSGASVEGRGPAACRREKGGDSRARSTWAVPWVTTFPVWLDCRESWWGPACGSLYSSLWGLEGIFPQERVQNIFSLLVFVLEYSSSKRGRDWLVLFFLYSSQHIWPSWIRSLGLIVAKRNDSVFETWASN